VFRPNLQNNLDVATLSPASELVFPAEPAIPGHAPAEETLSAETLDFDLDLPVVSDDLQVSKATPSAKPLDFDFDLELPTQQPVGEPSVVHGGESNHLVDEPIKSIALGLAATAAPAVAPKSAGEQVAPVVPMPTQAGTVGLEDLPPIDETTRQEVATKLELAQAYEEMGDSEGARELLQEVLEEGDQAQKEAARNKLALLG
jgi:pilus assembly protein FimV